MASDRDGLVAEEARTHPSLDVGDGAGPDREDGGRGGGLTRATRDGRVAGVRGSAGWWLCVAWVLVAALGAPGCSGAEGAVRRTLYVAASGSDSNTGTADQPLRTISRAAALATAGTSVSVAAGTYPEAVETSASGTASARIRFVSATRWGAQIRPRGAYRAWMNRGDFVDIVGFDVSAPDGHLGIQNEGSHVQTLQNHVHDVALHVDDAGCDANGGSGINDANYGATDNEMNGNVVHDIGNFLNPAVPTSCWGIHGLYQSTPGSRVLHNIVYRNEAFGITLWHAATGNVVSGNLSFNNGVGGIGVGAGDAPGGVTGDHYVVSNNIVVDNPMFGIRASGSLGPSSLYLNNLLYHNGAAFTQVEGVIAGTVTADPQFVNYQRDGLAAGGDYHLRSSSPAIHAVTRVDASAVDYDGRPRSDGTGFDIGPY
jgi:Protein of unknown function (DUF1565)/Right handed beta helix region